MTSLTQGTTTDSTHFAGYGWSYDADSRAISFTNSGHSGAYVSTENIATYSYDHDGQLTGAAPTGGVGHTASNYLANTYDANGNATSINSVSQTVPSDNQVSTDGTWTYTYDANGNLTEKDSSSEHESYTYDNRNRLIQVLDKVLEGSTWTRSAEIDYAYDVFDNLFSRSDKTYDTGGVTALTDAEARYVYDGNQMVLAFDASGNLTDRYLNGPAVDQVLADEQFTPASGATNTLPSSIGNTLWALGDNQGTKARPRQRQGRAYGPHRLQPLRPASVADQQRRAVCVRVSRNIHRRHDGRPKARGPLVRSADPALDQPRPQRPDRRAKSLRIFRQRRRQLIPTQVGWHLITSCPFAPGTPQWLDWAKTHPDVRYTGGASITDAGTLPADQLKEKVDRTNLGAGILAAPVFVGVGMVQAPIHPVDALQGLWNGIAALPGIIRHPVDWWNGKTPVEQGVAIGTAFWGALLAGFERAIIADAGPEVTALPERTTTEPPLCPKAAENCSSA